MFPQLNIHIKDQAEPVEVETTSLDLWTAEELQGAKSTEHGTRLICAYCHIVGKEPKNVAEVKQWARENEVRITLGKAPDPTLSDPGDDS